MLRDQNSRYANAAGKRNVASKVGVDELKNPVSMRNTSRSLNDVSVDMFSPNLASSRRAKAVSNIASEEMIRPRGPRSMGSAAGFRGEKTAYIEMNGGGYMGARRKAQSSFSLGSSNIASFQARKIKQSFSNKLSGRFAENAASRMKTLKSLSRLV